MSAPTTQRPDRRTSRRVPAPLRRISDRVSAVRDGVRNGWRRARSGQRPLAGVLAVALVASVVMLSGPTERYLDGRARVDGMRTSADALETEIAVLEARAEALDDPRRVEALAREQQGMIRPGEVPYTLVPPESDRPQIASPRDRGAEPELPWYARTWDRVRGWF